MKEPRVFTGASCLLFAGPQMVLEVRKPSKWEMNSGKPPIIGLGCIGGSIEAGETPLEALHREASEEINCSITIRPARLTADITPSKVTILSDFALDGIRPAMVWEVTNQTYIPGSKVAVFLAQVEGDPQPGDLPAIVLTDPQLILEIGNQCLTIDEARSCGAELRANIDLPANGQLRLANTLKRLYQLRETNGDLFQEFISPSHL